MLKLMPVVCICYTHLQWPNCTKTLTVNVALNEAEFDVSLIDSTEYL